MEKKVVAVIFGGESSEYEVSLKSTFSVIENLDTEKYNHLPQHLVQELYPYIHFWH